MDPEQIQHYLPLIEKLSWPGAVAVIAYALRPVWAALGAWVGRHRVPMTFNGFEDRLKELEGFKLTAETNHFHDLDNLMQESSQIWQEITGIRREFSEYQTKMEGRMTAVETKIKYHGK